MSNCTFLFAKDWRNIYSKCLTKFCIFKPLDFATGNLFTVKPMCACLEICMNIFEKG